VRATGGTAVRWIQWWNGYTNAILIELSSQFTAAVNILATYLPYVRPGLDAGQTNRTGISAGQGTSAY
jgi:hypothetical protein